MEYFIFYIFHIFNSSDVLIRLKSQHQEIFLFYVYSTWKKQKKNYKYW